MKAFIAVVLLAACAAAQTQYNPLMNMNTKETTLGNLWNNIWGQQNLPTTQYELKTNTILTLEQLLRQPLFQTYLTLPLFRQHLEHPLFQVYLTTPYFQQYWVYPEFQTFFRNPYLFYKYVYPVVFNTMTRNVWNKDVNTFVPTYDVNRYVMNKDVNTFVPTYDNINRFVINKDVNTMIPTLDNINRFVINKDVNTFVPTYDNINRNVWNKDVNTFVPTLDNVNRFVMNKDVNTFVPTLDNLNLINYINKVQTIVPLTTNTRLPVNTNYNYVMDKFFKTKMIKPEITTEIKTDVKIMNPMNVNEEIYRKIVDPITGEIKYIIDDLKNVDDKLVRIPIEKLNTFTNEKVVDEELIKDAILKKFNDWNKVLGNKKTLEEMTFPTGQRLIVPENKYEFIPLENEKLMNVEILKDQILTLKNKYPTLPIEQIMEVLMMNLKNKYETLPIEQIKEELMMSKFDKLNEQIKYDILPQPDLLTKDAILRKFLLAKKPFFGAQKTVEEMMYPETEVKYETLPIQNNKYEEIKEQMMMNKLDKEIKEQMMMNKFETIPTLSRTRRHAVTYNTPIVPTTYKTSKALNYYTVPLTYGTPYTTYASPLTYTVPTTTYVNQQYQVQPNLYYPGQTLYV